MDLLFWKVFKNCYLYNKIYSSLNIRDSNSFIYGKYAHKEINSVEWMIKNKHYSLLKDKVLNGEPNLSFYQTIYPANKNLPILNSIFNVEQLKSDRSFYGSLFKNYYDYFFTCSTFSNKEIVNKMIVYDNPIALDFIVQHFKLYELKQDDLIMVIQKQSIKILEYLLLQTTLFPKFQQQLPKLWKLIYPKNKSQPYYSNQIDKFIGFLIEDYKIPVDSISSKETSLINYRINYLIYNESLNKLISSCIAISTLGISSTIWDANKVQLGNQSFGSLDSIIGSLLNETLEILSLNELNGIKNQFTHSEFSKNIKQFKFNETTDSKLINISKLIKMVIPFSIDREYISNYLYYLIMYKNLNSGGSDGDGTIVVDNIQIISKYLISSNERELFFSTCIGKKELQIQYLLYFIGQDHSFKKLKETFEMFINLDVDLALIDILSKELIRKNQDTEKKSIVIPKSIKMFDYLLMEPSINATYSLDITNGLISKSPISILYHFKANHPDEFNKMFKNALDREYTTMELLSSDTCIEFVVSNIHYFKTGILKLLESKIGNSILMDEILNDPLKLKFFLDHSPSILSDVKTKLMLYHYFELYKSGNLDQYPNHYLEPILSEPVVQIEIVKRCDLKAWEYILSNGNIFGIKRIIIHSIYKGRLELIKYALDNRKSDDQLIFLHFPLEDMISDASHYSQLHILKYLKTTFNKNIKQPNKINSFI